MATLSLVLPPDSLSEHMRNRNWGYLRRTNEIVCSKNPSIYAREFLSIATNTLVLLHDHRNTVYVLEHYNQHNGFFRYESQPAAGMGYNSGLQQSFHIVSLSGVWVYYRVSVKDDVSYSCISMSPYGTWVSLPWANK